MKPWARLAAALREPLIYVMGGLVAISVALVLFFYIKGVTKDTLEMEIAKVALQGGIVAVSGVLLSLLVFNREQRIEDAQKEREEKAAKDRYQEGLLKATLNRITTSYNKIKRARRDMRALGLDSSKQPVLVDVERWDKCMACVNEAQLEFETIIIDVDTTPSIYPSGVEFVEKLGEMERYLGDVISEYEKERARWGPKASDVPLGDLKELSDFLDKVKNGTPRFKALFSGGHRAARGAIRKDLRALTEKPENERN